MVQRKTALRIRKTHRYLGLIIGIQFLAWTLSGLYFSWTDLDEIHGDQFLKTDPKAKSYSNLLPLDSIAEGIEEINLVSIKAEPYYWINNSNLYHAQTGQLKQQLTEDEAIAVAQEHLISGLEIEKIELIEETGPHHEFRERPLPAYAIHFKHPDLLVAYVDASSGIFQRVRHQSWRWFDFLWMTHTMDYQGRDDFNNILLRIFSLFGVFTVMSGFLLWGTSSPTLRKLLKR
ncbi:MAG: PepSY domain-containing protein [Flavobacteriaceae bacterium]